MRAARPSLTCSHCRPVLPRAASVFLHHRPTTGLYSNASPSSDPNDDDRKRKQQQQQQQQQQQRSTTAPRPNIDIKHIRQNPALHEKNCLERNYKLQSTYPSRINALFAQWQA
ncbi:Serine-tRNA ligase, partial [Xylaria longipes]